jgi:hypothetical protein
MKQGTLVNERVLLARSVAERSIQLCPCYGHFCDGCKAAKELLHRIEDGQYDSVEVGSSDSGPRVLKTAVVNRREARIVDLVTALEGINKLLRPGAGYSVCKTDGSSLDLSDQMLVGNTFEKADSALAAAKEVQP